MMKRIATILLMLVIAMLVGQPAFAQDQINYNSQPDELVVFFNNIAYARDVLTLPGGVDVRVVLPQQVYADTLVLREDGERVPSYRLDQSSGQIAVQWTSQSTNELREVTVEYLLSGVGWSPKYDLWLGDVAAESAGLDFFAEIRNPVLRLDGVTMKLVAGQVNLSQPLGDLGEASLNQTLAGYSGADQSSVSFTGTATIQHVYEIGSLDAAPGETIYTQLESGTMPLRRLHLWNAPGGNQVTVIYKVRNDSELPFAPGIVRNYQYGLFVGSDPMELTPIGSEGSVTLGSLQNMRVNRSETTRALDGPSDRDDLHQIVLSLENFGDEAVEIEVVDRFPASALDFEFSQAAQEEGDNVLRWVVTVEAGGTTEISYSYKN
jgi:hypothetical protein